MSDLAGKTLIVTGANTGIGRVTAEVLAARGARVWLATRSREKTEPVLAAIRAAGGQAEHLPLDLGDLASVRHAAETFLARGERLDVLVNNAGLAGSRGLTRNGFELAFGTNHLGPFLFTTLLLPRLRESAPARIVNVASRAHYDCKGIDWDALTQPTRTLTGVREYGVSKLCNVLFTAELARGRAGAGVTSYAVHPGVVASDVWRRVPWPVRGLIKLFMIRNEDGAKASLRCATDPALASHDGRYYTTYGREKTPSALAQDAALARELWERSERWVAAPPIP
jgi:NAD(P)-dependent dehydrogenase (short-subunit alcohol dehydrogenase family)